MNERIKELYQQAHSVRYHNSDPSRAGNPPTVYWQGEVSAQRFAELIVRECAELVKDFYQEDEFTCYSARTEIKEHFGVE